MKTARNALASCRKTGMAFIGPKILGGVALVTNDKTEKDEELAKATTQADGRCAEIEASLVAVNGKLDEMDRQRKVLLDELPARLRKRYKIGEGLPFG